MIASRQHSEITHLWAQDGAAFVMVLRISESIFESEVQAATLGVRIDAHSMNLLM